VSIGAAASAVGRDLGGRIHRDVDVLPEGNRRVHRRASCPLIDLVRLDVVTRDFDTGTLSGNTDGLVGCTLLLFGKDINRAFYASNRLLGD
jgi:hypothetical protein